MKTEFSFGNLNTLQCRQKFFECSNVKTFIKIAEKAQHFLSDASYKLTYENFPIITGGRTDLKETHEIVFNKTINFTTLIADNAGAITSGFAKVFDLKTIVNCWAHVNRNIDIHVKSIGKLEAERIVNDISEIQKIFDPELFPIALKLFQEKCSRINSPAIKKFLECYHLTTIAARKKKCNFVSVDMDIPIQANRKKRRPKDTAGPLVRQPNKTQATNATDDEESSTQEIE
ncbi:unnamed protein product [Brachionus calyciflorus]|uniref:MULE transposase domain-containing protein n=1 Tax=Brachionus calyciflorus TaxID=104777 RepID=A0A813WPA7_9BILA|nr:unnamed protein product [Brachionus calyciflorus]